MKSKSFIIGYASLASNKSIELWNKRDADTVDDDKSVL